MIETFVKIFRRQTLQPWFAQSKIEIRGFEIV